MDPEQKAKDLLTHYFELTAGGTWNFDGDNQAEIEDIVSLIIRATTRPLEEKIKQLENRISQLETCNLQRINGEWQ